MHASPFVCFGVSLVYSSACPHLAKKGYSWFLGIQVSRDCLAMGLTVRLIRSTNQELSPCLEEGSSIFATDSFLSVCNQSPRGIEMGQQQQPLHNIFSPRLVYHSDTIASFVLDTRRRLREYLTSGRAGHSNC